MGKQRRGKRIKRKQEFIALVAALRSCRLTMRSIGLLLGVTAQRVGQVVIAYQLDPPKFDTPEAAFNWLIARHPDLARVVRDFQKEIRVSPTVRKAA